MERTQAASRGADAAPAGRTGLRLAFGAALCLISAGALLWWREGDAIFAGLLTAIALCF